MIQYFYVLYNKIEDYLYIDNQFGYTKDILMAERYASYNEARDALKYFKNPEEWKPAVVTIQVTI